MWTGNWEWQGKKAGTTMRNQGGEKRQTGGDGTEKSVPTKARFPPELGMEARIPESYLSSAARKYL